VIRETAIVPSGLTGWSLPTLVQTRGGACFDPRDNLWSYRDTINKVVINFEKVGALSESMRRALKCALIWYAENTSGHHVHNLFSRFCHLVEFLAASSGEPLDQLTHLDLLNYKSFLKSDKAHYVGSLSGFLERWHGMGLPGVTDEAVSVLQELKIKGHVKGVAVLIMDPHLGPFSSIEFEQIQSAVNAAFASREIAEDIYLLTWLFMALGQRPAQYAALKVCDVAVDTVRGETRYTLSVPRVKQHNADPRLQLKERSVISQLGQPLLEYTSRVRQQFRGLLPDPEQAPLFPMSSQRAAKVHQWAPNYEYHYTGSEISRLLRDALARLKVPSERTGGPLHISPQRFRRTFGTRAAQEGHGELVIAELLDHSDTRNVGVYVAASPEIAERIDRALAMQLAPLAQAFKGVLIRDGSTATRGNDLANRIVDPRIDRSMKPMGSCGQHSFCSFNSPIACYTCQHFQPWLDGPHEAVLEHLLEKREQLLVTSDPRMAAVNDTAILAVAQVVQLCREHESTSHDKCNPLYSKS
jgi:integrase